MYNLCLTKDLRIKFSYDNLLFMMVRQKRVVKLVWSTQMSKSHSITVRIWRTQDRETSASKIKIWMSLTWFRLLLGQPMLLSWSPRIIRARTDPRLEICATRTWRLNCRSFYFGSRILKKPLASRTRPLRKPATKICFNQKSCWKQNTWTKHKEYLLKYENSQPF